MRQNSMKEHFMERIKELQQIRRSLNRKNGDRPKGRLRITHKRGKPMYYHEWKNGKSKYIRKGDIELARQLAQKIYEEKVLNAVKQEMMAIEKYMKLTPGTSAESVYEEMNQDRRKLIRPIRPTREDRVNQWLSEPYEGKPFREDAPPFYTNRGERVRSKSELIIANLLDRLGIAYKYEAPLFLEGYGVVYPDFTILHPVTLEEIYLEHFGMMDDPEYVQKALKKINLYELNGIFPGKRLILTHETLNEPLDSKLLIKILEAYLMESQS